MNIAIILAVSKYTNAVNNLPASKKDGEIINEILKASKKYDKIITINDNELSSQTKKMLSNFFIEHKGTKIEELFFYYSGHGEFTNDEFYYLLSDFDSKKKNQTSLQNTEIDDLIRTLNPEIVIKVIDACQSGTSYIKESDVLNKYFNETKKGFNKCYFFNSSLSNQSSYQDENLSFFTHSFVQAVKEHPSSEIRYKDIIDFILDDFQDNLDQTPFFVIQAELTEKFCAFTDELRQYLINYNLIGENSSNEAKKAPNLLEIVKANAKEYVDKEGALNALIFCKQKLENIKLEKEIEDLYNIEVNFMNDNNVIAGVNAIGKWLKDNSNDFLAKPQYTESYDEYNGPTTYLSGYDFLIDEAPFKAISIEIISKFPNLKSYQCNVAPLISKKQISFFYVILQYFEDGWDSKILDKEKIKWTYNIKKISDNKSILEGLYGIYSAINDKIKSDIHTQFGIKTEDEEELPF